MRFGSPFEAIMRGLSALNAGDEMARRERRARERARKAALRSGNPARREAARKATS